MPSGLVAPVGVPGGLLRGVPGEGAATGLVHLGDSVVRVDAGSYRLWRVAGAVLTIDDLVDWGVNRRIHDAAALVQDLLDAGLLVALDSLEANADSFVAHLRGELIGTPPDDQPGLLVEGRDRTALLVGAPVFEVLRRVSPSRTILEITGQVDELGAGLGFPPTGPTLAAALPHLVRREVILLDRKAHA